MKVWEPNLSKERRSYHLSETVVQRAQVVHSNLWSQRLTRETRASLAHRKAAHLFAVPSTSLPFPSFLPKCKTRHHASHEDPSGFQHKQAQGSRGFAHLHVLEFLAPVLWLTRWFPPLRCPTLHHRLLFHCRLDRMNICFLS